MNFPFYIAKRYLVSRKSRNIINIISAISVVGVSIGTAALIIVLSVTNGLNTTMQTFFSTFDPDLKITVEKGKSFKTDTVVFEMLRQRDDIEHITNVVEETALLKYNEKQYPATIKGVSKEFGEMTGIDSMIIEGQFVICSEENQFAVVGEGVAYFLGLHVNFMNPIDIYAARRTGKLSSNNPDDAIKVKVIYPSGIFKIHPELDLKYIIVPIEFANELFEYENEVTSLEIKLKDKVNPSKAKQEIEQLLGNKFIVKDRHQQHEFLNKTIQSEKWVIYLILTFILLIASFNIVGSLTMLIIDKKKDVAILRSLGASFSTIRNIFLFEGWLISIVGAVIGLFFGFMLAFSQQQFGWVKLQGNGSFIIDAYPVTMIFSDFVMILATVLLIGFIAAWYPIRYITRKYLNNELY